MFEKTVLPVAVKIELSDRRTPQSVRNRIASPPPWLEIRDASGLPKVSRLDAGEAEAIALAEDMLADLSLVDECIGFAWPRCVKIYFSAARGASRGARTPKCKPLGRRFECLPILEARSSLRTNSPELIQNP
jgi:hypothetical protein